MVYQFDWENTPDSFVLPAGALQTHIESLELGQSSNGKLMGKATFVALLPEVCKGMKHFENYVFGTDDAPMMVSPNSVGSKMFKQLCKACNVSGTDLETMIASLNNQQLIMTFSKYKEKDGDYRGQERNRVLGYHALGTKEVALDAVSAGTGPGAVTPAMPAGAPGAPAMPSAPAQPVAPTAPAPAAPAAPTPAAPVQPAPAPAAAPAAPALPSAPAPAAPAPTAPPAMPQAQQPVPAAQPAPVQVAQPAASGIDCTVCGKKVSEGNFSQHVEWHGANPGSPADNPFV